MILLVAALIAVAVPAAIIISSGSAGQQRGVQTIVLVARDAGSSFSFIDQRPLQGGGDDEVPTAGDSFAGSQKLFTTAGERVGTLDFHCTLVTGGVNPRSVCTGAYGLAAGTIMVVATFPGNQRPIRIAVVGGAGAYEGARGSATTRDRKDGTLDTIRLLP